MHRVRILVVGLVCAFALGAQISQDEYRARREAARKSLSDAVLVLFGPEGEAPVDPEFYYLTGWTEPGAILMLTAHRDVLFLPAHNAALEKYTGRREAATDEDARRATGFEEVLPVAQFEARFAEALEGGSRVYTRAAEKLKPLAPLRQFPTSAQVLDPLRAVKSQAEIALIAHSAGVTVEAHRAAWRRIAAGVYEYQVAATMTFAMLDRGCEGNAYDPIVGSGPNGTVLHYSKNSRRMEAGELVLMDVGAKCDAYAADVTRTVPVSGRFTPRERELYDIVLGAYKAALAAVKPGATLAQLTQTARDYFKAHGGLDKYLTHRITHGVGLEVHDHPDAFSAAPLQAGMVITIEPGLYIPEERVGIRIEDTVLVTEDGARVLSAALPKEAAEIERAMAR
ncbi:MAG: aminopeptidase P N-terminal domain-containing protein [Acidobacteriota bacterium]